MDKVKRNHLGLVVAFLGTFWLISGCTKTVPYDKVYKDKVHSKSEIDTTSEFIYVASTDGTSRTDSDLSDGNPYFQGAEEIVKLKFSEESLLILAVDSENSLQKNRLNEKVVLEIPIRHVDFRCAEDRYGKCTNREEENVEKKWDEKRHFVPDFAKMESNGLSLLPMETGKLAGEACFEVKSQKLVDYKVEKNAINFQIEKTMSGDYECLLKERGFLFVNKMGDLQTRVIYHYSLAKLDQVSSKNYEKAKYPPRDQIDFGFFSTSYRKYDVDLTRTEKMKEDYMNRWNPLRKEITYYLSDNFRRPEMKAAKKATELAFEKVNAGLKTAGVNFQLVLSNESGHSPGDVRNSMIVMVEDPIAGGPLGYGPSVTNPRTGEILSARTVMYYGNLIQGLGRTYDEIIVALKNRDLQLKNQKNSSQQVNSNQQVSEMKAAQADRSLMQQKSEYFARRVMMGYDAAKKTASKSLSKFPAKVLSADNRQFSKMSREEFRRFNLLSSKINQYDPITAMSVGHCMYSSELFPFNQAIGEKISEIVKNDFRRWKDLNSEEQKKIIDLLVPEIWVPVLVHELGHNLGLRHNFAGSEDKNNFYSETELHQMGINHAVPYSSVMDYGRRDLNTLPTLGKYDIATLRYGYTRKVEKENGELIDVRESLSDMLKSDQTLSLKTYGYCSDEHVEVNPNCKRFDEGTDPVEMVRSLIDQYHEFYDFRNFRNNRENFSVYSDSSYRSRIKTSFGYIRAHMERYERIKNMFAITDSDEQWKTDEDLKKIKEAALISGQFFLDVLKTPDLTCVVAKKGEKNSPVHPTRLDDLTIGDSTDCFKDASLKPEFEVVGQFGKAFNHRKSSDSENFYADQIDVRGIWIDKLLAVESLFGRRIGNSIYDRYEDNYLDMDNFGVEIVKTLNGLLVNSVVTDVLGRDKDGRQQMIQGATLDLLTIPSAPKEIKRTHWLEVPEDEKLAKQFGIDRKMTFQEKMLELMKQELSSSSVHWVEDRDFISRFQVIRTTPAFQYNADGIGLMKDLAGQRFIAMPHNELALDSIRFSMIARALMELTPEERKMLLAYRAESLKGAKSEAGNQVAVKSSLKISPADLEVITVFKDVPTQVIQQFESGQMIDPSLLDFLLTILPSSNEE